ncbi:MAG: M48 family metallopeptidase [Polymorphobacter sp.]
MFGLLRRPPADRIPDLEIGGRRVAVTVVRNARSRRITLRADAVSGVVRLTLPARAPLREAAVLLDAQRDWLRDKVAAWPRALPFVPGASIPFEGGSLSLFWDESHPRGIRRFGDTLLAGGPLPTLSGRTTRWLRTEALQRLDSETRALADRIGKPVTQVSIRDPASRWGSCSSSGAIGFSWRLVLAPEWVRQSVVAHEVAHLEHHNHGADFWALARALAVVDPVRSRRWLAANGAALHWIGRVS